MVFKTRPVRTAALMCLGFVATEVPAKTWTVPDDHKTIQASIDAAAAGDTILVRPGVYRERIRLKPALVLRSVGDDAPGQIGLKRAERTRLDGGGADGRGPGIAMAEGSVVDGFTVTAVGVYDETKWKKHHATRGEHQDHEHIGAPGTAGIAADGVSCVIRNNIVHHIGYTGIALTGRKGRRISPHVTGNVCFRNMGGGIGAMRGASGVIENNLCYENFYAGIGHAHASPTVRRNTCHGNIRAGIGISEGSSPVVRSNRCYENRRAGIGIRTGAETRPLVEANDCYENGMAGIGVRDEARPVLRANRCYRNRLAGIGIRTGAEPSVLGNECFENKQAGIGSMGSGRLLIARNHVHHNQAAGIGFDACPAGRAQVVGNRLEDNATVAVGIQAGWAVRLSGNRMKRAGGMAPMVMVFAGARAVLSDNTIQGGGVASVRLAGEATLVDNTLLGAGPKRGGPPQFGVWALAGSQLGLHSNQIRGWRHGLHATGARITATGNRVEDFFGSALVILKPSHPFQVTGNRAVTGEANAKVLDAEGPAGLVADNAVLAEAP